MSNEQLNFWMTCPDCKKVFSVEPRAVLQYLSRVVDAKTHAGVEPSAAERRMPTSGEASPETPQPKAPYRRSRPWKR